MNVSYEDEKLHNDGIFDGLIGYKEWFHYVGTYYVDGDVLDFMLGFPVSLPGMGALGWISYKGNQYSLAGNTDCCREYFNVKTRATFEGPLPGYKIDYPNPPGAPYTGWIEGEYPDYTINVETPDVDVRISMRINLPDPSLPHTSVMCRRPFAWLPLGDKISGWFHSGDVTTAITGTVAGEDVTTTHSRGWYERNWAKLPIPAPAEWFWLMTHLDNGAVFDLLIEKFLDTQIHHLDECWLYHNGTFHEFSNYWANVPSNVKTCIRKGYSPVAGECITCGGKDGDSFRLTATITDVRQYIACSYYVWIKWTNFILKTDGEAVIDGAPMSLKGHGRAEIARIFYWWL